MNFLTNARIAIDSLKNARTRTNLTMLGIVIGVVSITIVMSLGESLKVSNTNQVKDLGNGILVIRPGVAQSDDLSQVDFFRLSPIAPYATTTLLERDLKPIKETNGVGRTVPIMLINGSVGSSKIADERASIIATTPGFAGALKLRESNGQFIDDETSDETVVLGQQIAIDLYGTDQILGKKIKLRGKNHTVIGILQKSNHPVGLSGIDLNQAAIINLDSGKTFNQGIAQIQQILVVPKDRKNADKVRTNLEKTLLKQHGGEKDFQVLTGPEAAIVSKSFYKSLTTLTAIVAGISLIVGGVGIMNIMLVAVAERTREIGIRKSLGASNQHIMWQFLIEALIISLAGGFIGIVIAIMLSLFISMMFGLTPVVSPNIMLITLGLSVTVGVIFGLGPALRAALKDPIEALREQS